MKNILILISITAIISLFASPSFAQEVTEIVPVEVDITDINTVQQWGEWIIKIIAAIIVIGSIAIFGFNVLGAQSANSEEVKTGRSQGTFGNLGKGFVLMLVASGIGIVLWNAAPFIVSIVAPAGGS